MLILSLMRYKSVDHARFRTQAVAVSNNEDFAGVMPIPDTPVDESDTIPKPEG